MTDNLQKIEGNAAVRYTAVFEWPAGSEPSISTKDIWLGGKICACNFSDALAEMRALTEFVDQCVDLEDSLPVALWEALGKIRPRDKGPEMNGFFLGDHYAEVCGGGECPYCKNEREGRLATEFKDETHNAALRGDSGLIAGVPLESTVRTQDAE